MNAIVPPKISELIEQALNVAIKNFSIHIHDPNKKGDGYMGEMCYISLQNKKSGKLYNLVVKQAFSNEVTRKFSPIRESYLNEIHFYTKVSPCFQQFQMEVLSAKPFNKFIKCFGTTTEEGFEKLVLENIKYQKFEAMDKRKPFNNEHFEYIFKQYGKFHALSFAYRALNPEGYAKLSKGFEDIYLNLVERETFRNGVKLMHEITIKSLEQGEDDKIIQKYKYYIENASKAFFDSNNYKGKYSVILHGDCWSNNMMFKYDESRKLCDMRFIDFQLAKDGNPVSDLAYFFYSGASKESLDQLDYYLKVYHNSLLEAVEEFGVNSKDIYPFEVLKGDWKQHCQLGFTMALFLWKAKFTHEDEIIDLTDLKTEEDYMDNEKFLEVNYDEEAFKKITRDLLLHLYENDFLVG